MVPVIGVIRLGALSFASVEQGVEVEAGVLAPDARSQRSMPNVGRGFVVVTPM